MESLRHKSRKPTHPGAILREDILPALRMTQTQLAASLGVSRRTISELVHERRPISVDMAIRLGRLCGNGAKIWLQMQLALDIWISEQRHGEEYRKISTLQCCDNGFTQ